MITNKVSFRFFLLVGSSIMATGCIQEQNTAPMVQCEVYIDGNYRFTKTIDATRCETYCATTRPDQACDTSYPTPVPPLTDKGTKDTYDKRGSIALPSGLDWTLMYSHDTLGITQSWLDDNYNSRVEGVYARRRGSLTGSAPGGGKAFVHTVRTTDIVEPFRYPGPPIARNNSLDNAYLLRFKHYVTAHSGASGKLLELEGGRGYVSDRYRSNDTSERGTGGWGANLMHPKIGTQNYYRLLASHDTQATAYGSNMTDKRDVWPIKQWVTVDVVATVQGATGDKNRGGYRIYVDGQLYMAKDNINIFRDGNDPSDAKTINYYVRLMHGGNADEHMAVRDYVEYLKDLQLFRGTY